MDEQLQQYCDYLKKIKGLSDRTIYHYLTYHRHFKDIPLSQETINLFIQSKNNNNVCRGYLKSYIEFLKREREFYIPKAKTGSKKSRLVRSISKVEINKIRDYAYLDNVRDGIIFDLLYFGALRRAEINSIKVNSFNWSKWFSDIEEHCDLNVIGKRDKERRVAIHPKTMKTILKIYYDKNILTPTMQPSDVLEKLNSMDDKLFKKMTEWKVWKIVKKHSIKAINRDIRTHEIRHARATELEEAGASPRDIQRYLGHGNLITTEIYLHSDEGKSLDKIKEISKTL